MKKQTMTDERILLICKSISLENYKMEGEFFVSEYNNIYKLTKYNLNNIQKSIKNLKTQSLQMNRDESLEVITQIDIFENIKYVSEGNKSYIKYKFNQNYFKFIFSQLEDGFYLNSSEELARLKSSYSPKLLKLLKSKVYLQYSDDYDTKMSNLEIPYDLLRKVLLGGEEKDKKYLSKKIFNQKVLKKAIDDINGYTPPESEEETNRNTPITIKLTFQKEKIEEG